MRRLIVTADDFGAASEVNAAVEAAHRRGVLTAASLMIGAPAAAEAVAIARALPTLRVGLHLVLVEGRPVLPPGDVDRLVDADGVFRHDMARAGVAMALDPRARRQLAAEIAAQFDAFAATGLALDHVNAHKHFQLHPVIGRLIAEIGARHGLRGTRAPVEPAAVLARVEPDTKGGGLGERALALWAGLAARRARAAGLTVPDQVFGLRWSGAMTTARLAGLIADLPAGLSEIYMHPATRGGFAGAAAGYDYAGELAALVSGEVARAVEAFRTSGGRLGGFADFGPGGAEPGAPA